MKFLIEKDVFLDGTNERLIKSLEKQGAEYKIIPYIPFDENQIFDAYSKEDGPIFFYGSISCMKRLQYQAKNDQLGFELVDYCNWNLFRSSVIYNRLEDDILNDCYRIFTVGEILNDLDSIFGEYSDFEFGNSKSEVIFCKSDEGDKRLFGGVYNKKQLKHQIEQNLNHEYLTKNDLLIVSEVRNIKKEYRVVVNSDGKIITGTCYSENGKLIENPTDKLPKRITQFLYYMENYSPAPVFVVDIAIVKNYKRKGLYDAVIECGSINMCGLYGCDTDKIVDELIRE